MNVGNKTAEPVVTSNTLRQNRVPRHDIANLRVKLDARSPLQQWWIVCDSVRAKHQLVLAKCLLERDAVATMERVRAALQAGVAVIDVDREQVEAVCTHLITWEIGGENAGV